MAVSFKFMHHTRDDVSIILSNWEYWCWYKAQVVHQRFSLPLCILCFTPRWQEWLALSQTCVLEVQECPVHASFRFLKQTWRLINTCNLHTRPCVQVRLLKSCQAHTRCKNWGKGGILIKAPLPEHFITWAVLSGPHVSLNCKIVFFFSCRPESNFASQHQLTMCI